MNVLLPGPIHGCYGGTARGRHAAGIAGLEQRLTRQARNVTVCMGRNDGASGKKRRNTRTGHSRSVGRPDVDNGLWYEQDKNDAPSGSGTTSMSAGRPLTQPSAPARDPSNRGGRGSWEAVGRTSGRQSRRPRVEEEDEEDEDTRGWWERPEERSLQAYAAPTLQAWQEERLQLAYAAGRRKVQVQELARELDVDRSVVLAWIKEFSLRPQKERDDIIAARLAEERVRQSEQAARDATEAATGQRAADARIAAAVAGGGQAGQEAASGFIPFYLRKQLGADKQRRISGEVLRTLESIYDRTPFPSADVVRGLFELHRLPRDMALEWFAARREADGITSSTQKRTARPSQRQKDRDIEGAFSSSGDGPANDAPESSGLLGMLGGAGPGKAAEKGAGQQPAEPKVVRLRPQDMAALRSSMPSPNKHKGRQRAEQLDIKTGPDSPDTQIGNIQFVVEAPAAPLRERVRASWRFRAASPAALGAPAAAAAATGGRRLRLRGRAGASRGGDGKVDGSMGGERRDGGSSDADDELML
ncbi:hypothetical protein Agub_g1015 [Astrephomene gubernaculifera]|uniref:Homeobox domain-containing protein n=1 Tax=Astrephomene gubernaculifera TaxID=47775 RepID=A0AAD3DGR0_9CHLO|nr:hypothetical protein Agub_g1015 [Astrephomene gubernaculifera]